MVRKHRRLTSGFTAAVAVGLLGAQSVLAQLRAFPEAEGLAGTITGGRGQTVYHVTNLNDSGAGSFRDAVSVAGRTVVFDVGGWINLASTVSVKSNITIAGQTAPGEGIGIRNYGMSYSSASNVISRHFRVRQGPYLDSVGRDAISCEAGSNLMFDHLSATWGRDETFSIRNSPNVTVQNSIIGEGLLNHSMGGLIEWNSISMHHNLFISNNDRNPKAKGAIDFVNNVLFNWGGYAFVAGDSAGLSYGNVVGNYFIAGPSSSELHDPISRGNTNFSMYMEGNWYDGNVNGVLDGDELTQAEVDDELTWMSQRFNYPQIYTDTAQRAYEKVLAGVGASLWRDSVDARLVNQVITQTGYLISDPAQMGGWNSLVNASRAAGFDTDLDGMPDAWETAHGLNPADIADRNNIGILGYTRLEEYLNEIGGAHAQRLAYGSGVNWANNLTWGGALPTVDDEVYILGSGTVNGSVTINQPGAGAFYLHIGSDGPAAGESLVLNPGGTLDVRYLTTIGKSNNGLLQINGGTMTSENVVLGSYFHAGTLQLNGGTLKTMFIANDNPSSLGTFTWNGGTLAASGALSVATGANLGAAGGTLDTAGFNATLSGNLSGAGALTKTGAGIAYLTGSNSYAGGTVLKGGELAISTESNIGGASSEITFDGGFLRIEGAAITNLNSHAVNWSSFNGGLNIADAGNSFTVSQNIGGAGSFTKSGPGMLTLSGTNSYIGGTTVSGGTLGIDSNSRLGDVAGALNLSGGAVKFTNAGSISTARSIALAAANTIDVSSPTGIVNIDQAITGSGSLTKAGAGTLVLHTVNSYTGETIVAAGTLKLGNAGALQNSVVNLAGGSLDLAGFNATLGGLAGTQPLNLNGSTLTIGKDAVESTYSGNINSASAGTIVKVGTGTVNLSGTNTYAGGTYLKAGALGITTDANIGGAGSAITFQGGLLRINGATLTTMGTHVVNWAGFNGGFDVNAATHTFTVSSNISGSGSMTKDGAGVLVLSGTNTYSGGTVLKAGALSIGTTSNLGGASSSITFNGGLLRITGTSVANLNSANVNWSSFNGGFDINSSSNTFTVAQLIAGNGNLTKAGSGTLVLNAQNTFTGDTNLTAGNVRLGDALALRYSTVNFAGGQLDLSALSAGTLGGVKGSGTFDLKGKTYSVGANNQDTTLAGALQHSTGTGTFIKVGTGTLTLTGSGSFAGVVRVQGGVISVPSFAASGSNSPIGTGSAASKLVLDGGTLRYSGGAVSHNRLFTVGVNGGTLEGSGTSSGWKFTATTAIAFEGSGDRVLTLAGTNVDNQIAFLLGDPASGKLGLRKIDMGRWILDNTAAMTYSGDTEVVEGNLIVLDTDNLLPYGDGKGNLVIYGGAQFEMNGKNLNINALMGSGNLNNRNPLKTLTVGNANASGTFEGVLSNTNSGGVLAINKVGTGTQAITGMNSYVGGTTVTAGTLIANKLSNGTLTVNGGTAQLTVKAQPNDLTGTTVVPAVSVAAGAKLDLGNNSLVVNYTSEDGAVLADTVRQHLLAGRMMTSAPGSGYRFAYATNADLGLGTFSGVSVDSTAVLVMYTLAGDANFDGKVNTVDFNDFAGGFGIGGNWISGDFDYSGTVTSSDFALLAANYGRTLASAAPSLGTTVPEPSVLLLPVFATLGVRRRRIW